MTKIIGVDISNRLLDVLLTYCVKDSKGFIIEMGTAKMYCPTIGHKKWFIDNTIKNLSTRHDAKVYIEDYSTNYDN